MRLRRSRPVRHRLAADVEVAVLEPEALIDRLVRFVDVERRRLGLGQDVDLARLQLDLAGRHARVLRPGQPASDLSGGRDDELVAHPTRRLVRLRRVRLVDDDLRDPVAVTDVQEDQLSVVATTVHPAREARVDAGVGAAQLTRGVGAIGRGETGTGC
jgi:hypothetical protein